MSSNDVQLKTIKKFDSIDRAPDAKHHTALPMGSDDPPTFEEVQAAYVNKAYVADSNEAVSRPQVKDFSLIELNKTRIHIYHSFS